MVEKHEGFVSSVGESEHMKAFLNSHLPYTLPLLRRLQYHLQGQQAIVICSFEATKSPNPDHFAVAFLDPQAGGIQSWISTSLDPPYMSRNLSRADSDHESMLTCLRIVFAQIKNACASSVEPNLSILVGCINAATAKFLQDEFPAGFIMNNIDWPGGPYGKYLLRRSRVQEIADFSLPEDFYYDEVRESDYDLVIANNNLVGTPQNLIGRPGVGIRHRSTGLLTSCKSLTRRSR